MNRVKKIEEVILGGGDVLVEMIEQKRKSGIVLPKDGMSESQSSHYGIIVAVGGEVKDLEVGDIVLKTRTDTAPGYNYKDRDLLLFSRYNIAVAIKPANFDTSTELLA